MVKKKLKGQINGSFILFEPTLTGSWRKWGRQWLEDKTSASPLWPLPATEVLIKDDCYCITHGMNPLFQELQTSSFTNQPCITAATPHSCFIWHQSKWNSTSLQIRKVQK